MKGPVHRFAWVAAVLIAAVLLGELTPLCGMPECDDTSVSTCSDFTAACGECPETVVMKHSHDDALTSTAPAPGDVAGLACVRPTAEPVIVARALDAPDATASPPPLDPLGVRLTI